ncbi:hypothetical protein F0U60_21745 [Archangium minus]|uniref:Uncharacterized protein n=1 Tax=Archangium minus TaxID=83450 RepID=A0ABY9WS76_9BACT|nr:hypothetical protein F0U60_21745 [Archangium minus]
MEERSKSQLPRLPGEPGTLPALHPVLPQVMRWTVEGLRGAIVAVRSTSHRTLLPRPRLSEWLELLSSQHLPVKTHERLHQALERLRDKRRGGRHG